MADVKIKLNGEFSALDKLKSRVRSTARIVKDAFKFRIGQRLFDGLASVMRGLPGQIGGAIEKASDLSEEISKSEQIFGSAATGIQSWAKLASAALGQSEAQALGAASTMGNLFRSMGLTEGMSAKMSRRIVELASDLASFNNTSPEDAILALGAGLRGEAEPLRRYSVLLDAATLKAQAMAMGMEVGTATLPPATRALAAYQLILEQTAIAQGDFARTSDGLANSNRTIKAIFEDVAAELGEDFLPTMEMLAQELKEVDFQAIIGGAREAARMMKTLGTETFRVVDGMNLGIFSKIAEQFETTDQSKILGMITAARSTADPREIESSVFSRGDVAAEVAAIAEQRAQLQSEISAAISGVEDEGQRQFLTGVMDAMLSRLKRQQEQVAAITDEQIAANAATRDAAAAEAARQEALRESAKAYEKASKEFEKALESGEKRRIESLGLEDQIAKLDAAEARLRAGLNDALQTFYGDASPEQLAEVIKGAQESTTQGEDMRIAGELLKLEQRRAEVLAEITKQETEAAAERDEAVQKYSAELAMLDAQIAGNDEKLRQLEDEAALREKIAELTAAGVADPESKAREMVEKQREAERADTLRGLTGNALEAIDPSGARRKELESDGLSGEDADRVIRLDELTDRFRDLGQQQESLGFRSNVQAVDSRAAVGAGTGVYTAGLDYDRQLSDLNRQQLETQREMVQLLRELRMFP